MSELPAFNQRFASVASPDGAGIPLLLPPGELRTIDSRGIVNTFPPFLMSAHGCSRAVMNTGSPVELSTTEA